MSDLPDSGETSKKPTDQPYHSADHSSDYLFLTYKEQPEKATKETLRAVRRHVMDDYHRRQKRKTAKKHHVTGPVELTLQAKGDYEQSSTAVSTDFSQPFLKKEDIPDHAKDYRTLSVDRLDMKELASQQSASLSMNSGPHQTNPFDMRPLSSSTDQASPSMNTSCSDETTNSVSDSNDDDHEDADPSVVNYLTQVFLGEVEKIGIQHFFSGAFQRVNGSIYADDHHDQQEGSGVPESGSTPASASEPSSSSSSTSDTSKANPKRKLTEDDESGPSKNRRGKEGKKFILIPGSGPDGRRFACYFNKHNPHLYRSRDETGLLYETCASRTFENVHRLFDHLKKIHCENPYQCPTCGRCHVDSPDCYFEHVGERSCAQRQYIRIKTTTPRKIETFRSDLKRLPCQQRDTESAKWRYIFYRLFDKDAVNMNPYSNDPYAVLSSLQEEYVIRRLRQLPPDSLLTPRHYEYLNYDFIREFRLSNGIPSIDTPVDPALPPVSMPEMQTSLDVPTSSAAPQSPTHAITQPQLSLPQASEAHEPLSDHYDTSYQNNLAIAFEHEGPSLATSEDRVDVLDNFDFDGYLQQDQTFF